MRVPRLKKMHIAALTGSAVALTGFVIAFFSMNTQFDLIMPDGAEMFNATLGRDNFSKLQQNVGVFTVYRPHATTQNATIGYCPIAEFIHEHEDGYNDTKVGNTTVFNATIPPHWCDPETSPAPVPEFTDLIGVLSLAIGTLLAVTLSESVRRLAPV